MLHQSGRHFELGWTLLRLGRLADRDGHATQAARYYAESLRAFRDAGMVTQSGYPLTELCNLLLANGHHEVAERLVGTIRELGEQTGAVFEHDPTGPPSPREETSPDQPTILQLPATPSLPLSEALDEAIAAADALAAGRSPSCRAAPSRSRVAVQLSAREQDVLSLLVQRYTAPEIADQLFISVRTVERHVANVYNKLGVNSRRAAAALALQHGLV
jgi:DNA-binding CsgD family transcriptional regulator